ncbi:hypothetical protein ACPOL_6850 (plasmid) [Acidisarcina polymorpha]|uniref:Uncharacterized protein n=1 Tax=Acidisarcina polymorpha TaxID=2211140 RepID=A0A2Z5GAN6_9BACT|nr:hypothetical protein ACPOL_6850 [Acidisarcina polymorpha]
MTSGMASVVASTQSGAIVEVGVIGHEGIVGSFHILRSAPVSTESFIHLEGTGLKIPLIEL